jgi:phosphatidylserine/phosphatidylglycerophosphate/cardiolipin synthase-like enzyme
MEYLGFVRLMLVACALSLSAGCASRDKAPDLSQSSPPTAEVLGVYFSPPAGAAAAIVKAIDTSNREVLVQAYGFTHQGIAQALVRAQQRGVTVRVLLDMKTGKSNRGLADVLTAGLVAVREDGKHAIAHNKVMVIDAAVVITGSFNFTNSAETRNAENTLILKSVELAKIYKNQWSQHWAHGRE